LAIGVRRAEMGSGLENLEVLKEAQRIADETWSSLTRWDGWAREVVGLQLVRAVDSIGANIAEAFGRYHYADKIRFLYYARGSLYEAKFWIDRAQARGLVPGDEAANVNTRLTGVARQLNALIRDLRSRGQSRQPPTRSIRDRVDGWSHALAPQADQVILEEDLGLPAFQDE
jgi:four helix bundle protein